MRKLKQRRRRLSRKINRRQKWRQRIRRFGKSLPAKLAKRLDNMLGSLASQLKRLHKELREVEDKIERLRDRQQGSARAALKWELAQVGRTENTDWYRAIAADMGYSPYLPWCSIFQGYALVHHGGFHRTELPSNPAYSGAWLTWRNGRRVSYSDRKPGDLLIFDWGDGGLLDHVAMYAGDGMKVGGNENDRVEHDAVPTGAVVAVIRPDYRG